MSKAAEVAASQPAGAHPCDTPRVCRFCRQPLPAGQDWGDSPALAAAYVPRWYSDGGPYMLQWTVAEWRQYFAQWSPLEWQDYYKARQSDSETGALQASPHE